MRLIAFFFTLFLSSQSFAVDYSWRLASGARSTIDYPSPLVGCTAEAQARTFSYKISVKKLSDTLFECWGSTTSSGSPSPINNIGRQGTGCPVGSDYNPDTGACDKNPCTDTAGSIQYHLSPTGKTRPTSTDPWPAGSVTGSPTMCSGSCQYSLAQSTSVQCGSLKYGDPLIQYCLFKYSGTGQSCQSGDPAQNNGSTAPVPPTDPNDPTDPANNCGPTHVWSGTTCVPKLDPDPADPTDPGTGGTDPGTGGGGPGTGGGDPGTGGGDPGTGGGDPGTGGGDSGDDGPDEEGDSVKGEACDLDLTCEGDAIQCAMLRQQKTDRCNWELNQKNMKQIVDSFTGDKYELGESTTDIGLSFNSALSSPRFLPSGCPAPQRITIQGLSYSLTWAYVCDFASGLSYVIVALAGLFFVVYVGRGFGGD